ncbi:MAG: UvrD-helicase domain-containing protein [Ruminococcaceae bacterium]|nr:UvrD-helicase domain-containing protein [Oscillospiraceae bacterium]
MQTLTQQFTGLRRQYIDSQYEGLNPMQREAVVTVKGPLLILAGAGSGKTTVLVNRVANLIRFGNAWHANVVNPAPTEADLAELQSCLDSGAQPSARLAQMLAVEPVRPWNILAITFTNKAAGELKARLASLLGEAVGGDVNASTFHSACVRILRREADKLGFPQNFTIYDMDDQQRVMKDVYKSLNIDEKFLPPRAAASAIGRLKDRMISPTEAAETPGDARAKIVAQVYAEYARRCKSAGAFDFDDLIYFTVRLLREHAEARKTYQSRYKYILVDEYQDTSVAQFQLVNLLSGDAKNVCVVGDDDQSIYRFRGATIENILSFEQIFSGAKVIRLEQNYRSTTSILNAANSVIKKNAGRKGKTLWTDNPEGQRVEHYCAANEQDEAAHIAEYIGNHLKEGVPLRDNAVLYRMNAQSSPVENYFARAGIPYKIVGGLRFNDRKEIRDLHAYMSIVANPRDDLRLRRIINEPSRKIGAVTLDAIAEIAAGLDVPMLEVIRDVDDYPALSRAAGSLKGFYDIYQKLVQAEFELQLEDFAAELPEITGYNAMLKAAGEEGLTRLENIGQLVSNVKSYADMNGDEASLEGYLEEIALIADIDNYDETADKVVLMTLHAAKGLEFPYVYIIGMEEGIFPSEPSRWNQEDVEEERRLCYVGITRAKKELVLLSANSRLLYGQTRRNPKSRFLEEIDDELLERKESPFTATSDSYGYGGGWDGSDSTASRGRQSNGYLDRDYNRGAGPARGRRPSAPRTAPASTSTLSAPVASKPQNAGVSFAVGDAVEHKVFGRGTVKKVTPVAGDSIVEIAFDKVGTKKTMANYAPLTKC